MIHFCYIALFTVLASVLELALRSFGLYLPLLAPFVFYLSVAFSWRTGLILGVLGGLALDFSMGHLAPMTAIAMVLVVALAMFWLYRVESDAISLHVIPGALLPVLAYLPPLLYYCGFAETLGLLPDLLLSSLIMAFYLPVEILLLDTLNERIDLDLYLNAKVKRSIR